ncbi:MAG: phosphoribosylglycinamide formyltransferase [Dehalococcoidia bacterium]
MLKIGWFSTARGQTSRRLLKAAQEAIQTGGLDARIIFVFSNREPGESPETDRFFEMVRGYGLPLLCLSSGRFRRERGLPPARAGEPLPPWRLEYDRHVMRLIEPYGFDLGVLAGYMLIVGHEMCGRYPLLNLHPAPPGGPAGTWQEVIWHLIATGAERAGAMMHLATPELDQGPPVTYCTYPIHGPDFDPLWEEVAGQKVEEIKARQGEENRLFSQVRRYGVARELPLVVATLRAFAEGRVRIEGGSVVDAQGRAISGYDLTAEIDRLAEAALRAEED